MRSRHDSQQCTGIKGAARERLFFYFNPKEEASASERETPNFTLRHNANLIVRGTSPGTYHLGEGLSLQEQLHEIGRKTRTKVRTRAAHPYTSSSYYTVLGPSYTRGPNPVVLIPRIRRRTHNI
ncbi:hypothetical protein BHE74_00020941 [Ensete ventricosum]|nr:hypothetical protein BHE74_00020941 [Ensete ventricosum]